VQRVVPPEQQFLRWPVRKVYEAVSTELLLEEEEEEEERPPLPLLHLELVLRQFAEALLLLLVEQCLLVAALPLQEQLLAEVLPLLCLHEEGEEVLHRKQTALVEQPHRRHRPIAEEQLRLLCCAETVEAQEQGQEE
jgi:hypothetical protein